MSDYMFLLESHLSPAQNSVVQQIQLLMAELKVNVFLTGGALRDLRVGLPVRDLNFTLESNPIKLVRALEASGVTLLNADETRKSYELLFPNGVLAEVSMARVERPSKPGAKPRILPATIHEDLKGRDFTLNALAVSLARNSRGLLLDPTNGTSDFTGRELRTVTAHTLSDDPSRLLKLVILQARLGFALDERTRNQYNAAREAKLETQIPPEALRREIIKIGEELNPLPILEMLDKERLLDLYFPGFTGPKINAAGFQKIQRLRALLPFGVPFKEDRLSLFLAIVSEKWTPKEKQAFLQATAFLPRELSAWRSLESKSKALQAALQQAKLSKPSQVYATLIDVPAEQLLILLHRSTIRSVQDRIKNFLAKYLPTALEITDEDVLAAGLTPGTPKGNALKKQLITKRLDARPKKVVTELDPAYSPPPEA
jgi:tRNA nucleotidyltransferase (CCA-adding enzyme)